MDKKAAQGMFEKIPLSERHDWGAPRGTKTALKKGREKQKVVSVTDVEVIKNRAQE